MWGTILSFIGGPIITGIIDGYKARLASINTTDAQAADLAKQEILAEIEARKAAATIILAEQGRWYTALPRTIVQYSFALFIFKCVVWDNMLGWGNTDPIRGQVGDAFTAVMVMWFGGRTIEKVAQIFKR